MKEYVSDEVKVDIPGYSLATIENISCSIKGDVSFGDRVVLFYKTTGGEWEIICGKEGYDDKGNTFYFASSIPAVDAAFILVPDNPKAGDTLFFELVPGAIPVKSITWY